MKKLLAVIFVLALTGASFGFTQSEGLEESNPIFTQPGITFDSLNEEQVAWYELAIVTFPQYFEGKSLDENAWIGPSVGWAIQCGILSSGDAAFTKFLNAQMFERYSRSDCATGPQGQKGDTGSTGATGPQGEAGPQGPAGLNALIEAEYRLVEGGILFVTATDLNGNGVIDPEENPQAVFVKIPAGPQGPQGLKGNTGATGATGPQGPAGADGATGPQGPQGETGSTGLQGPAGADGATGPQGPQGETGATGANGFSTATDQLKGPDGTVLQLVTCSDLNGDNTCTEGVDADIEYGDIPHSTALIETTTTVIVDSMPELHAFELGVSFFGKIPSSSAGVTLDARVPFLRFSDVFLSAGLSGDLMLYGNSLASGNAVSTNILVNYGVEYATGYISLGGGYLFNSPAKYGPASDGLYVEGILGGSVMVVKLAEVAMGPSAEFETRLHSTQDIQTTLRVGWVTRF